MKILIINGPNLNLLGLREPAIYGTQNYAALEAFCKDACREAGFDCEVFQSNHEGAIVDKIQQAYGVFDGIVINPAAYTHTSVAILDALKAVALPAVEVHLSDVDAREAFRQRFLRRYGLLCPFHGVRLRGLPAGGTGAQGSSERKLKANQWLLFFLHSPRYTHCVSWGFSAHLNAPPALGPYSGD